MVFGNLPVLYMTTLYNYTHSNKVLNTALCFYKVSMKPLPCFSRNTIQSGWSPCPTTPLPTHAPGPGKTRHHAVLASESQRHLGLQRAERAHFPKIHTLT